MKNLVLIRHAKSSWKDATLSDIERPLNKRGKQEAPSMGQRLKVALLDPGLIVSSPAVRALKTARKIARVLGYDLDGIIVRDQLYLEGVPGMRNVIAGLDDRVQRVYLVGHNPDITELAIGLTGVEFEEIPTCGIVSIEFSANTWADCNGALGRVALVMYPEMQQLATPRETGDDLDATTATEAE